MNLKYHASAGIVCELIMPMNGMVFLISIIPDLTLIKNEYLLFKNNKKFNENEVSEFELKLYMTVHSIFMTSIIFMFNYKLAIAHFIHIFLDWFTHVGRFSSMPIYPFSYRIKFGRNIFK